MTYTAAPYVTASGKRANVLSDGKSLADCPNPEIAAQIADALNAQAAPAAAPLAVVVRAELDGWPVDLELSIAPARLGAALARLGELGYTPRREQAPAGVPSPARKAARPRATEYDTDGTPICPVHGTPMREGQHGYYCGMKAKEGQPAGPKGYCNAVAD